MALGKDFARSLLKLLIPPYFQSVRYLQHHLFLGMLGSRELRPPAVFAPVLKAQKALLSLKKLAHEEYINHSLEKYSGYISKHYAKDGLAYSQYDDMSPQERLKCFQSFEGRLNLYLSRDPGCFGYKDGDSFLDAGCGPGQNIKVLMERYPRSKIRGFDLNKGATEVVNAAAAASNLNVAAQPGSVLDFNFLETFESASFDHVFISHVFTLLIGRNVVETRRLRQRVVDELIRISRKSFLLMDSIYQLNHGEYWVEIEQKNRCTFVVSLSPYFTKHQDQGTLKMMFSNKNSAILFEKLR